MKKVPAVRLVERDETAEVVELSEELRVSLAQVAGAARDGLLAMSATVGLMVMHEMMNAEMTAKVGAAKHAKVAGRKANWHGDAAGSVVLGGRRVPVERPRGRTTDGREIELDSYATFSNDDLLSGLVMERMLAGVATRRHVRVNEPVGDELAAAARSTSRSSVSRRFKTATQAGLDELMSRDLSELKLAALMLDGVHFAETCCVVALAICTDGTKVPVGLWLGDTENKTVVTALLADLVDRGLSVDGGLLVVIDGAKALAAAVRKVFGEAALIQRCTLHKRRNVKDHLPKDQQAWVDRKLAAAFANENAINGERAARDLAKQLEQQWPDAAASLREGLDEMFTVRRLGINGRLAATLTNTNCIESMISIARDTTRNVKRWRDGTMIKRWCAAGMLNAERSFRRLKGHKQMPALVAALERHIAATTPACDNPKVA
ncbi:MAG TPA: IS256 family transposase [Acidimicrobiia bacterium]